MRIDSHHHFWDYSAAAYPWISAEMAPLRRDFAAADLQQELALAGIEAVVSVQARQTLEETEWLLGLAQEHDFIHGVVGWLPLADAQVLLEIERLAANPWLKSVRHVVQDEPDNEFILGKQFNHGVSLLRGFDLAYDILIFARHLPHTIRFVDQHPEQRFVLDHIAKPTIAAASFDQQWQRNIRELAKREHVVCKFSGLVTEVRDPEWSVDLLQPYWDTVLEAFSPRRLMFGSDWPVCLLRSQYASWVAAVQRLSSELTPDEQADFSQRTAIRTYQLQNS